MVREWDARTYDSLPLPHTNWGRRTLARLDLGGVERVLEAGCGTGRDTELLLELAPDARAVAVDGSGAMLEQLRVRLADQSDRVEIVQPDLTKPLPVQGHVDAVFSVATFHWISDHDTLFRNLGGVLRPGGQFVADCSPRSCLELTSIDYRRTSTKHSFELSPDGFPSRSSTTFV